MRRLRHLSTIIADLGDIFVFVAPVTCVPLAIAVLFSEWNMLLPMAAVPVIFFLLGIALRSIPGANAGCVSPRHCARSPSSGSSAP